MARVSLDVPDAELESLLKQLEELTLAVTNVRVLDKAVEASQRQAEKFMGITEYIVKP